MLNKYVSKCLKLHIAILAVAIVSGASATLAQGAVKFAVLGDYGGQQGEEASVANLINGWNVDFIVQVGDGRYDRLQYDSTAGRYYCKYLSGVTAGPNCPSGGLSSINRFFPAIGNHDRLESSINDYYNYFTLPGNGITSLSRAGGESYYDFVQGPVHFFVLNSEFKNGGSDQELNSRKTQKNWLKTHLASSTAIWKVVVLHRPPFSSGSHRSHLNLRWPFAKWGANAVLSGHDHTYERLMVDGTPYFVNGLGGYSIHDFNEAISSDSYVRHNSTYGAMRVTANNEIIKYEFIDTNNTLIDTFITQAASSGVVITSPTEGSVVKGTSTTVQWKNDGLNVGSYRVVAGTFPGDSTYDSSGRISSTNTSYTVKNLPANGATVYVRLFYAYENKWRPVDTSFTSSAAAQTPRVTITSPEDGASVQGSSVTLQWDRGGKNVVRYYVTYGSYYGNSSYGVSNYLGSSVTSYQLTGLPANGATVYVRLHYDDSVYGWRSVDTSFTSSAAAQTPRVTITSPTEGSVVKGTSTTVQWKNDGSNVSGYRVVAGTSPGNSKYAYSQFLSSDTTSFQLTNLPANYTTVYVRLFYSDRNQMHPVDTSFISKPNSIVKKYAPSMKIATPTEGSVVKGTSTTVQWKNDGLNVSGYYVYAGRYPGDTSFGTSTYLSSSAASYQLTKLPANGTTVYVRLYYEDTVRGWQFVDTSFTSAAGAQTPSVTINSLGAGAYVQGRSATLQWNSGGGNVAHYLVTYGSYQGDSSYGASSNLGSSVTSFQLTNLPANGTTVYARLYYYDTVSGWRFVDTYFTSAAGAQTNGMTITSPRAGAYVQGRSTTLQWNSGGVNVAQYLVSYGSYQGDASYGASSNLGSSVTSIQLTNLPANGTAVYARLYYYDTVYGWKYVDRSFISW